MVLNYLYKESFLFNQEIFFKICVYVLKSIAECAQIGVKLVFEALAVLMLSFGMFYNQVFPCTKFEVFVTLRRLATLGTWCPVTRWFEVSLSSVGQVVIVVYQSHPSSSLQIVQMCSIDKIFMTFQKQGVFDTVPSVAWWRKATASKPEATAM